MGCFFIPVTRHTFRHSWVMHLLYHRQPLKVMQALDVAVMLSESFNGEGAEAAAGLKRTFTEKEEERWRPS